MCCVVDLCVAGERATGSRRTEPGAAGEYRQCSNVGVPATPFTLYMYSPFNTPVAASVVITLLRVPRAAAREIDV